MTTATLVWVFAALFLPLFPLSMIFNAVFTAARRPWLRIVLVLVWPQIGLWLLAATTSSPARQPPTWLLLLAVATAVFYAWRMLSVRAVPIWIGFWITSAWSLAWVATAGGVDALDLRIAMAGVSLTGAVLVCGAQALEARWGEAYLGLRSGLGRQAPRLAGLLVMAVLAALGAPLLPMFFVMLWLAMHGSVIGVVGVMTAWLLWSWSAALVWQALLFGNDRRAVAWSREAVADLSTAGATTALLFGVASVVAALIWSAKWLMH